MTVLSELDSAGRRRSPVTLPGYHAGRPVGCVNPSGSRGGAVLVNEPTESIPAADPERIGGSGEAKGGSRLWRHESRASMRTMAVVGIDVGGQDAPRAGDGG